MYVESLRIRNLRSIEAADVTLQVPSGETDGARLPNVTLLLGDNGSGKTTVLRAIALAALAPVIASGSGYVPFSLVRRVRGASMPEATVDAQLVLHPQDGPPQRVSSRARLLPTRGFVDRFAASDTPPWAEAMWDERSPAFLLVGYGSTRRAESQSPHLESVRQKSRILRYDRVAGLFEDAATLVPLSGWLPGFRRENPGRHKQVVHLLNKLLAPHAELLADPVDGEYLFRVGGSDLPFAALSDGYRGYISWITDLLYHICTGAPSGHRIDENRGVVLVDEVDLHLHPEWQREVIPTLARTLPRLQFVFTSHSPLVAGTVWRENVVILDAHEADGVRATALVPSREEVYGLSADQILTSGHFGLRSPRNEAMLGTLTSSARAAQSGDPGAALRFMRLMTLGGAALGESAAGAGAEPTRAKVTPKRTSAKKKAPR